MEIPWQNLESDVLNRLLAEIVTRDGTDYGALEMTTEQKIDQVKRALQSRRVVLRWDAETESASIEEKT